MLPSGPLIRVLRGWRARATDSIAVGFCPVGKQILVGRWSRCMCVPCGRYVVVRVCGVLCGVQRASPAPAAQAGQAGEALAIGAEKQFTMCDSPAWWDSASAERP